MSATTSLTPALSPRRGRTVRRVFGNAGGWIGRMVCRIARSMDGKILSLGEGIQVRAGVKHKFKRSHKVSVALTVQEILDGHIAKKLVWRRRIICSSAPRAVPTRRRCGRWRSNGSGSSGAAGRTASPMTSRGMKPRCGKMAAPWWPCSTAWNWAKAPSKIR